MTDSWAGYLQQVAASPDGARLKAKALDLLRLEAGQSVVDVGCGPATDTIVFGRAVGPTGSVTGIDADLDLVERANAAARVQGLDAWVRHMPGSALALPFADAAIDAWHAERVLQHLPGCRPLAALREALRVVRPRGRLVVVDTDWATLSISSDHADVERRLVALHLGRVANGLVGRDLVRLVRQAGWTRTEVRRHAMNLSPTSLEFVLGPTEQAALGANLITPLDWHRWRRGLADSAATGDATAVVVMTVVAAVRP